MFGLRLDVSATAAAALADATQAAASAEWVQWDAILTVADRLHAEVDREADHFRRMALRSAIPLTIGQLVGLSEGQVSSRVAVGERVRSRTPNTWKAFRQGRVDGSRIREISRAIEKLQRPESHARLDRVGLAYAESHTLIELRGWLKRFIARIEPEAFNARADEERRNRHVEVVHDGDGMGWLFARLPSFVLAATDNRLNAAAGEQKLEADPDDDRTLAQRRADILGEWLLSGEHAPASLTIDVAVMIPATALTGGTGEPAISADGQWGIPTSWALDEFMRSSPFWHRLIIDPVQNDVLTTEYLGRFAPDVLTRALRFTYPTCQAPGCCIPAHRCDIDHRRAWPDGTASGANLWPLCRKHHNQKGHQVLRWVLPDGREVAPEKADLVLAS